MNFSFSPSFPILATAPENRLRQTIGGVLGGSMEGISYRPGPSNTDGLQGVLGRGEHTAHLATLAGEELAFFASFSQWFFFICLLSHRLIEYFFDFLSFELAFC